MKILRQIYRGCGTLPHVGEHPGTVFLTMLILMGGLAGAKNGFYGAIGGAVIMGIFNVPVYLYGAYGRAQYSDHLCKLEMVK
jgi:hypothetical protein